MPDMVTAPYIGNGHYCYANVTAMLLASIGEHVSPSMIEVLGGTGVGAGWTSDDDDDDRALIFFDSSPPDRGVSNALQLLGFEVTERTSADSDPPPWHELTGALAVGPAILGPVDMGLLVYGPRRGRPTGVDHYVLAYAMDDDEVFLHDPAGLPHVSLARDALAAAWRAEHIAYRRGAYRWWSAPRRVASPTDSELFAGVLETLRRNYQQTEARVPSRHGQSAIMRLAERVRTGNLSQPLLGHLTAFAFQVAARRAHDFAMYFEAHAPSLAVLKHEQARLFGRAHTLIVRQDCPRAADSLVLLATIEGQFRDQIVAGRLSA